MNSKITLAAVAALAAAGMILRPKKVFAWAGETHTDITENALGLIEKEKKTKLFNFYSKYSDMLIKGSTDPDREGDIDRATGTHYYSCATFKGKKLPMSEGYYQNRLGDFAKSARTILEDNYSCALHLYKNDKPEQAVYYLGRAIHFLEDISNPVHTANMKYEDKSNNPHKTFEKHTVTLAKKYVPDSYDKRLTKLYSGETLESPLNKLSETANKYAASISQLDPKAFDNAAADLVPLAAQNVVALMMRFYEDCLKDNSNYIKSGKSYMLRNEGSGNVVTVTPKGLVLDRLDREKSQKIGLIISDGGSFALKAENGLFVSGNLKALDTVLGDAVGAQFRFTCVGKNKYRISAENTKYTKFLSTNRSGALMLTEFVPGDKNQIWIVQ